MARPTSKRAFRILITVAIAGAVFAGGAAVVQRKKASLAAAPRYGVGAMPLRVATVRSGDLESTRDYLAVVEPIRSAPLSSRLTAAVEEVHVYEGDRVTAGQVLVVLDGQELRDAIAAAKAQIDQAQAELASNEATVEALNKSLEYLAREAERTGRLLEGGAASVSEADAVQDRIDERLGRREAARQSSQALEHRVMALHQQLNELQTRLGYSTIASPYDGVVSQRHVDPGALAVPGNPLISVEDCSQVKLAFEIPQQDLPLIQSGMHVTYRAGAQSRTAPISVLAPLLNQARMLRAEVILAGEQAEELACGAYVPVSVVYQRREAVALVPDTAIVESPGRQPHVFALEDGRLLPVPVNLLGSQADQVAVEGIDAGREVVVSNFLGWAALSSGRAVEVLR